jgi:predicted amidohydrolase YtcJ
VLIVGGAVEGKAGLDVRTVGGRIAEVGPALARHPGEEVVDARGGAVIPALWDHHLHLRALAAARSSVAVGPPEVVDPAGLAGALRRASAASGPGPGAWVRGVGYHDSVAGPLDRWALDAIVPDRPVRVQHRSGALWVLNSAAVVATGLDGGSDPGPGVERDDEGRATGRLWRMDRWLAGAVPPAALDLAGVGADLARAGVAGVTDADPRRTQSDVDLLARGAERGELPLRMLLMSVGGLVLPEAPPGGFAAGPRKLLLDDATLPPHDELVAWLAEAHAAGEAVAVHCVTRVQLVATVAALEDAGARPGDRVEHGSVVPPELLPTLRALGLTVVTQPNFVAERGDRYLAEVDEGDRPFLYPCASLRAAGVAVAAGTDAPFGRPDPWAAMRAAVGRRTAGGATLLPGERVGPATALGLFQGHPDRPAEPRRVAPGEPADLCVLDRPLADALRTLTPDAVALTIAGGTVTVDNR